MASSIAQGASAGAALGTALMPGVGTAVGAVAGGALGAIPALVKTDAEKENARRLNELKRQREMGMLGLTEQEKQLLFSQAQGASQAQMQQIQAQARAAGASGMQTGAGNELVKQQLAAEQAAQIQSQIAQEVEAKNLARKRELEDEIQQREAAKSEYQQERLSALTGIGTEALGAGAEYGLSKALDIKQSNEIASLSKTFQSQNGLKSQDADAFAKYLVENPETKELFAQFAGTLK